MKKSAHFSQEQLLESALNDLIRLAPLPSLGHHLYCMYEQLFSRL